MVASCGEHAAHAIRRDPFGELAPTVELGVDLTAGYPVRQRARCAITLLYTMETAAPMATREGLADASPRCAPECRDLRLDETLVVTTTKSAARRGEHVTAHPPGLGHHALMMFGRVKAACTVAPRSMLVPSRGRLRDLILGSSGYCCEDWWLDAAGLFGRAMPRSTSLSCSPRRAAGSALLPPTASTRRPRHSAFPPRREVTFSSRRPPFRGRLRLCVLGSDPP